MNIERSFLHIAKNCGLDNDLDSVKRWLSNIPESWALIFDNADDPSLDISRFFPVGNRGVILITTRNPGCKFHATVGSSELGRMETDEAITLILRTGDVLSNQTVQKAAEKIVLALGCLALAIVQAGAVIRMGRCRIEEYPAIYSRRRKDLLQEKMLPGNEGYEHTVYTTWEVSLRMIEDLSTEAGRDAIELLQMFSFFHFDGISEEILHQAWRNLQDNIYPEWVSSHQLKLLHRQSSLEWDSYPVRVALSILSSYSLISRDKDHLISIHPLVHAWARDRMSRLEAERLWTHALSTLAFSVSWSFQRKNYQYRKCLVPHIDTCLVYQAHGIFHALGLSEDVLTIVEIFALVYQETGRQRETLELTEKVVEARERMLGKEHPNTLRSMHNLAISYSKVGQQQKALELAEKVVEAMERTLGKEHPTTLTSMHNLALRYSEVGQRQKALELTEKVAEARERTLGEEHPDTLGNMNNLAIRYSEVGQQQKALELAEKVVEARERLLGKEHPDTLASMHDLAISYSEVGQQQKALELAEKVTEARERTLGKEHPDTLSSMHSLAIRYSKVGQQQKALELAEKVVEATEKVVEAMERTLGEEHPETLRSMHSLAIRYSKVGQQQKALELAEKVVEATERTMGEEHPNTLSSIHNLAIMYSKVGQKKKVMELIEKVVEASKRTLGKEHPDTLRSMNSLAVTYSEVGQQQKALELAEKVAEARERTLGKEHPDTLSSMNSLAVRYSEVGQQ